MKDKGFSLNEFPIGSALILTIVLTSLLAIVGALFVLAARMDRMSTSAVSENKDLDLAVDSIISKLSQELVLDSPGIAGQEYYDYPGDEDRWLASLEPYYNSDDNAYEWGQISDVTGYIENNPDVDDSWAQDIEITDADSIISDNKQIVLDADGNIEDQHSLADADGDGVADAKWVKLEDVSSGGKPVFAAVRVIDNGGMLNVNTGYKFDPGDSDPTKIDGRSQTQINFTGLSKRGSNGTLDNAADKLQELRKGDEDDDINKYENNVIWQYDEPDGAYTPFDISEELSLRNRYLLKNIDIETRLEDTKEETEGGLEFWKECYDGSTTLHTALDNKTNPGTEPNDWFWRVNNSAADEDVYDYRHISTTHNMDRIIDPNGEKMLNANGIINAQYLYDNKLILCIDYSRAGWDTRETEFAQIAANIKDYADADSIVTTVSDVYNNPHYGFERPCIYISEVISVFEEIPREPPEPNLINRAFGIELYKRFSNSDIINPGEWWINFGRGSRYPVYPTAFSERGGRFYVMIFENPDMPLLSGLVEYSDTPPDGATGVDPNIILKWLETGWWEETAYDVYFMEEILGNTDVQNRNFLELADDSSPLRIVRLDNPADKIGDVNNNGVFFGLYEYDPSLDPDADKGKTYYWRIDDVNENETEPEKKFRPGPVMSFTTWEDEPNDLVDDINENDPNIFDFEHGTPIILERMVPGALGIGDTPDDFIPVDIAPISNPSWTHLDPVPKSEQRNLSSHLVIKHIWNEDEQPHTLGHTNRIIKPYGDLSPIQAWPAPFHNVGEVGKVFRKSTYPIEAGAVGLSGPSSVELGVRIDLTDPDVQKMFNYLTVMDPASHVHDGNETRVTGRININTAPWYVIAQLPWVSDRESGTGYNDNYGLADEIATHRDKPDPFDDNGNPGFKNIGQLNNVVSGSADERIDYYWWDNEDQRGFPDLTTSSRTNLDGAADDFEERNLIFSRISDLVTVRSDVFTAYILVRIGTDGPQKRVVAVLDRSNVKNGNDKVETIALHTVPDPR